MTIRILQGDCREVMKTLDENSVDSIVCDPPYELTTKRPGGRSEATKGAVMRGFMGMKWDGTGVANDPETWRQALRVLKPGGYLLAFGGTRTFHRMVCAIEDAGFELRDCIGNANEGETIELVLRDCPWLMAWVYGSGYPKSRNGEWGGTALKPAWEPICMARKPLIGTIEANWLEFGTGALNIEASRIDIGDEVIEPTGKGAMPARHSPDEPRDAAPIAERQAGLGRWPANVVHDGSDGVLAAFPEAPGQIADASSSSSSRKTQNVYGAMKSGNGRDGEASAENDNDGSVGFKMKPGARRGDEGSAARFFYSSKASRQDRNEGLDGMEERMPHPPSADGRAWDVAGSRSKPRANHHPTVKPTDLMRYLCRLVTPPGGVVLDPFMGSGSTLKAAELEGFSAIGIELDPEYVEIARRRIAADAPLFANVEVL